MCNAHDVLNIQQPSIPVGHNAINLFIITKGALELVEFLENILDTKEDLVAGTTRPVQPLQLGGPRRLTSTE